MIVNFFLIIVNFFFNYIFSCAKSQEVRKAAVDALYNSLEFIRDNFEREVIDFFFITHYILKKRFFFFFLIT